MTVFKRGACAVLFLSMCLMTQVTADDTTSCKDKWYCGTKRHYESEVTHRYALNPCGNPCPPHVKAKAIVKDRSESPVDGWYAYGFDTTYKRTGLSDSVVSIIRVQKIKSGPAQTILTTTGPQFFQPVFTPDGEWLILTKKRSVTTYWILWVKRDGSTWGYFTYQTTSTTKPIDSLSGGPVVEVLYTGPNTDYGRKIYEILIHGSYDASAIPVDFSGATPVCMMSKKRQIAKSLPANTGGFDAAKDIFLWDYQVAQCIPIKADPTIPNNWAARDTTYCRPKAQPCALYTIPNNGLGITEPKYQYPVYSMFNCGSDLSYDGQYLIYNNGRMYADCVPNGHQGFEILHVRRYTDPVVTVRQWCLEPGNGAVSVNWCPDTVNGVSIMGTDQADFNGWRFTNDSRYVTGTNFKSPYTGKVRGCYLVDWQTSTWYLLTDPTVSGSGSAYLTDGPGVQVRSETGKYCRSSIQYNHAQALDVWTDLLGRSMPGSRGTAFKTEIMNGQSQAKVRLFNPSGSR